jgi:hypothetical protein
VGRVTSWLYVYVRVCVCSGVLCCMGDKRSMIMENDRHENNDLTTTQ